VFRRIASGRKTEIQLVAANIDVLFVVSSCNEEFKESRLERYLTLAAEAGAIPVVVLTKIDLTDAAAAFVTRARAVQAGVAVVSVNALDPASFGELEAWIEPGSTVALVGSSGVGKSTILNSLVGSAVAATAGIREDDKKGRHTTSHRALYRLPGGGLVIDVPGMRELGVADIDEALGAVFGDIESLSLGCRFPDCGHDSEPGCAVRQAIDNGDIDARRLANYRKLVRENRRHTASLSEVRKRGRELARQVKQVSALKRGRRLGE
jgi:ribosome biogenesis GTPase